MICFTYLMYALMTFLLLYFLNLKARLLTWLEVHEKMYVLNVFRKGESYWLSVSTNLLFKKKFKMFSFCLSCFSLASQTRLNHQPLISPLPPQDSILAQVLSIISKQAVAFYTLERDRNFRIHCFSLMKIICTYD